MSTMKNTIPNYLQVFERKLDDLKKRIRHEISKPKKERSKHKLKLLLGDAKGLKKALKEVREDHKARCPHCHKDI